MSPEDAGENANENAGRNDNGTGHLPPAPDSPPDSPPSRRSLWIGLAVLGAALGVGLGAALVIGLVAALAWWGGAGFPRAGEVTGTPSATSTPDASIPPATRPPTATPPPPSVAPAPGQGSEPAVPLPASCTQLYSPDMVQALGDLTLNPAWSQDPDSGVDHGTDDVELRAQIDSLDHLTCVWASPFGGSDTGIITNVVTVTPEQKAAVEARLVANGLECSDQSGGRRCVIQTNTADGAFGESHFLRNGIWLATKYTNAGPRGYTQDIIDNLWVGV